MSQAATGGAQWYCQVQIVSSGMCGKRLQVGWSKQGSFLHRENELPLGSGGSVHVKSAQVTLGLGPLGASCRCMGHRWQGIACWWFRPFPVANHSPGPASRVMADVNGVFRVDECASKGVSRNAALDLI